MESMTIGQALSGLSMALFLGLTVILLVALSTLAGMGIMFAFIKSGQMLVKSYKEAAAGKVKKTEEPKRQAAKVARIGGASS